MNEMLADNFRTNVKALLATKKMTRAHLAQAMDCTAQYVTIYLNGHSDPGLAVVERFASALQIDPCDLLDAPRSRPTTKIA